MPGQPARTAYEKMRGAPSWARRAAAIRTVNRRRRRRRRGSRARYRSWRHASARRGNTREPCNPGGDHPALCVARELTTGNQYTLCASGAGPDRGSASFCKRAESCDVALASNHGARALPARGWGILGLAGDCLPHRRDIASRHRPRHRAATATQSAIASDHDSPGTRRACAGGAVRKPIRASSVTGLTQTSTASAEAWPWISLASAGSSHTASMATASSSGTCRK